MTARAALALAVLAAVAFGFGTTFSRLAYDGGGDPGGVLVLRTLSFVLLVGAALALSRRKLRLGRRALLATVWMAGTLACVSVGYQGSVAFIPVSLAALIFYNYPIVVGLLSVVSGRDRISLPLAAALVAAFLGLALALGPGLTGLDGRGVALALLATFGMTLTVVFGGKAMQGEDPLVMALYTNVWLLAGLAGAAGLAGGITFPSTGLGVAAVAGVCASYVLAYTAWYRALSLMPPIRLAGLLNIEPVVTLAAAWLVLGERLAATELAGAALVLASLPVIAYRRRSDEPPQPDRPGADSSRRPPGRSRF